MQPVVLRGENRGPDLWNGLAVRCKLAKLELAFLDSPNELDPCNRGRRIVEQLKPKHRAGARLDSPMVLLHDIVEILRCAPGHGAKPDVRAEAAAKRGESPGTHQV